MFTQKIHRKPARMRHGAHCDMSSSLQRRTISQLVRRNKLTMRHFCPFLLMCCFPNINLQSPPNQTVGVAPFSGANTGTGGRIRDVQSAGRGGHVVAGTAGYCFGNLHIPGQI